MRKLVATTVVAAALSVGLSAQSQHNLWKSAKEPVAAVPSPGPIPETPEKATVPAPATTVGAGGLTNGRIADALVFGHKGKGKHQGLILRDSGQGFMNAMTALNNGLNNRYDAMASNGFWLEAFTPLAWIQQRASQAAKEYRSMSLEDVTAEDREDVFRVFAHPDNPNTITAQGMRGTSAVRHVVLRSENRGFVVQPLTKTTFGEESQNGFGAKFVLDGVLVTFPMSALRELRGPKGDREFFITIVGATGEEKNFKVKQKHFQHLR